MKNKAIVSLADSNYFELLNELIESIKRFEQSKNVSICVLDSGLTKEQHNELSKKVDEINWKPDLIVASYHGCLLYTSPSPRDLSTSRMPSSA